MRNHCGRSNAVRLIYFRNLSKKRLSKQAVKLVQWVNSNTPISRRRNCTGARFGAKDRYYIHSTWINYQPALRIHLKYDACTCARACVWKTHNRKTHTRVSCFISDYRIFDTACILDVPGQTFFTLSPHNFHTNFSHLVWIKFKLNLMTIEKQVITT